MPSTVTIRKHLIHIIFVGKCSNVLLTGCFFPPSACATVRGQAEMECAGIRCYCPADSDALPHSGGHVSVNMHYQNPKTNVGG